MLDLLSIPSPPIQVLLADDNQAFLIYLASLLLPYSGIIVVGTASRIDDLLSLAENAKPDAVFLDVEMPDGNGFEIADKLYLLNPDMDIVYVTAFPEMAIKGFEVGACDYLSKPITVENLERSVKRLRRSHYLKHFHSKMSEFGTAIAIRTGSDTSFLNVGTILCLEKVGHNVIVNCVDGSCQTRESLDSIGHRLPPYFFRSHRGFIVNLCHVKKIQPLNSSSYELLLSNSNSTALLSKKRYAEFLHAIRDFR